MPGIRRDEIVYINRLVRDYSQDELPNPEQIRYDFGRLAGIIHALDKEIEKMSKREA